MPTIIGVESRDGVVLAADRRHVDGGVVTSDDVDRVADLGDVACAAVGDPGDVDSFHRQFESEIDRYRDEHDRPPTVDVAAELAGDVAATADVQALVAGRSDDDDPALRVVDDDGGVYEDDRAAFGSGVGPALAALDAVSLDEPLGDVEDAVRDALDSVAERDAETGDDVDVVTVAAE